MQLPDEPSHNVRVTETDSNSSAGPAVLYAYFEQMPQAIMVVETVANKIAFINTAFKSMLSVPDGEISGQPLFQVLPAWQHSLLPAAFQQAQAQLAPVSYQATPLQLPGDKSERFFDLNISLLHNISGSAPMLVLFAQDVTRQVITQQKNEAQTNQLVQMTDVLPQLVWIADVSGTVVFFNRRVEEYWGAEQMPDGSWAWTNMIHPEDLPATQQAWAKAVAEGSALQIEHRVRKKDGQYKWHLNRAFPHRAADGTVLNWFGTLTDIDDQKKAAEHMRERDLQLTMSQSQLGMAISTAEIGVWQGNVQTGQVFWSKELEHMYGLAEGAFGGTYNDWKVLVHPDDLHLVLAELDGMFHSGDEAEVEYRIVQPSGKIRWIFSKIRGYRDADGNPESIFGVSVDVTSQRSHQQQLADAEQRWRIAIEANNMGTWEWNTLTNEVELSPSTRALLDIPPDEPWHFDKTRALTVEADVAQALEQVLPVVEGKKDTFMYEARHERPKTGQIRWVRMAGKAVRTGTEKPTRIIGTVKDITSFKENEQAQRYHKQLLETVTANTSFALFLMDERHHCVYMNEQAEKMTGFKMEEIGDRPLHYYLHHSRPDGSAYPIEECPIDHAMNQSLRTKGEEVFIHKNGDFYPVSYTSSPILLQGRAVGSVIEVRDITEEKKVAQVLQLSEERFRVLTNTIPQITWISNNEGLIDYISDQWEQFTGQQKENVREGFMACVHPDDVPQIMKKWEVAKSSNTPLEIEYRLRDRNGNYRWFFSKTQPLLNSEGEVISWIGAGTEIQHFKDLSAILEEEVANRTHELRLLNQTLQEQASELQRSNEDLQQFAHVASHDLKEPVRKIKTFGSRIFEEFGTALPERALYYLKKIDEASDRIYSMIDGVLEYAQLDATELKPEPVSVKKILEQIISDLELTIQEKNAEFIIEPLPILKGQPILLYQLFYNLVNNSLKFAQPGVPPRIVINATDAENGMAAIAVIDNGIGFNQEHSEKIFKTFTRLNAREKFEGTGLGLAQCRKIAARHGGSITAAGKPGQGATFTVTLPVDETESPSAHQ